MKRGRAVYRWELVYGQYVVLNCHDRVLAICSRRLDVVAIVEALNGGRRDR